MAKPKAVKAVAKTRGLNTPEARAKREMTLANKATEVQVEKEIAVIANQIPEQWADTEQAKLSLAKSIHSDVLGVDKEGSLRPVADLRMFLFQAAQRNLNPFKKQIHAVYIWDSKKGAEQLIPITGIDGFATIAQRTNRYAGLSETRFTYFPDDHPKYPGKPESAIVDVYAYNPVTGAREIITTATAWWDEYVKLTDEYEDVLDDKGKKIWNKDTSQYERKKTGKQKINSTWDNRSRGQLEKCAQALGLRRAFPEELSGLYVIQEVDKLERQPDSTSEAEKPKQTTREVVEAALRKRNAGKTQPQEAEIVKPKKAPVKRKDTKK